MKKNVFFVMFVVLLMGATNSLSAQEADKSVKRQRPTEEQVKQMQEKMHQMQIDQMSKVLMLDDAKLAQFKTLYDKYLKEQRECRVVNRKQRMNVDRKTGKNVPQKEMTDEEIAQMLKQQFAQSRKMLDLREKYYYEFSKILTQKQIMKVYMEERMNMNKYRKEFERRKGQKPGSSTRGDRMQHHRAR